MCFCDVGCPQTCCRLGFVQFISIDGEHAKGLLNRVGEMVFEAKHAHIQRARRSIDVSQGSKSGPHHRICFGDEYSLFKRRSFENGPESGDNSGLDLCLALQLGQLFLFQ